MGWESQIKHKISQELGRAGQSWEVRPNPTPGEPYLYYSR